MDSKEKRIRQITQLYYSNKAVQDVLLKFASEREVVPRYFEGFGKRPDILQYSSDVMGAVRKGATSFHVSEEIWHDPLGLSSEITSKEMDSLRKGWDLLIDIDSPFLDCSKIASLLIIKTLEEYGIKKYGVKFSGSKGFHIIVGNGAFPEEFNEEKKSVSFPEWPRAICEFITNKIRPEYNREIGKMDINFAALETRTKIKKEDLKEAVCPECSRPGKKGKIVKFKCPLCGTTIERKNVKITKKRLKCLNEGCAGILKVVDEKDYFHCEFCKKSSWDKFSGEESGRKIVYAEKKQDAEDFEEGLSGNKMASLDLVLVAPRHLFRMPYSLHEKTALASVVISKSEIENFSPKDANPMKVKIREFMPENKKGEATRLLVDALLWKRARDSEEQEVYEKKYEGKKFEGKDFDYSNVDERDFPPAIKKLLKGLEDGRKRGLFVLLTFFKSIGYGAEEINKKTREWNGRNEPPLKEGYIRSQVDWHLKQQKKILPPNYSNDAFYRDIGILKEKPKTKNPLVDVMRKIRDRK
ncbi:MAG: hypothetical protein KJ718_03565 [Nanoarchaeota archaeon]|nr:hypothetical protein [Nanoarchaeota archaeon]MBU1051608.1 hypothetical protein [Nanoarchaeota archaeon]